MTRYDRTFKNFFKPVEEDLQMIADFRKQGGRDVETEIATTLLPNVAEIMRLRMLKNMRSYAYSDTDERHSTIIEAFKILEKMLGFKWNEKGSFTKEGAEDQLDEDVQIDTRSKAILIHVSGRLEDMERGKVSWGALRSFFYKKDVKQVVYFFHPDAAGFYDRLKTLFAFENDHPRPYVSRAVDRTSDYMHEGMKIIIEKAFPFGEGEWMEIQR